MYVMTLWANLPVNSAEVTAAESGSELLAFVCQGQVKREPVIGWVGNDPVVRKASIEPDDGWVLLEPSGRVVGWGRTWSSEAEWLAETQAEHAAFMRDMGSLLRRLVTRKV